jgi:dCMP deaminase
MKDVYGRPDWDNFFLSLCFMIARRSLDQHTKHGCVIVDERHRIISTGYNGPPGGLDDATIPLTRPEKYKYMEHSELNAILNSGTKNLVGSTFYITGLPCHTCFRQMKIVGAKRIIHAGQGSHCLSEEDSKAINILNGGDKPIEIIHIHSPEIADIFKEASEAHKKTL